MKPKWQPLRGGGAIAENLKNTKGEKVRFLISKRRKTQKFYTSYQTEATNWLSKELDPREFDSLESAKKFIEDLV